MLLQFLHSRPNLSSTTAIQQEKIVITNAYMGNKYADGNHLSILPHTCPVCQNRCQ